MYILHQSFLLLDVFEDMNEINALFDIKWTTTWLESLPSERVILLQPLWAYMNMINAFEAIEDHHFKGIHMLFSYINYSIVI